MAMLRAMDAAVAGLRAHQNKMNVIGNNLANVNTFGFKAQTYTFKESMYQSSSTSSAGSEKSGGTNAAQYGYGSVTGAIGMDMTPSSGSQADGLNAMIRKDGFFITKADPLTNCTTPDDIKGQGFLYTRVGQFQIDSNGFLTDQYGNYVYGFAATDPLKGDEASDYSTALTPLRVADPNGDPSPLNAITSTDDIGKLLNVSIDKNGVVKGSMNIGGTDTVVYLGKVGVATFQNPNGLTKENGGYYSTSDTDNAGQAGATPADGMLDTGMLETSNVDVAKEFTEMITAQRGFQANSRIITVSDEMLAELMSMKR